MAGTGHSWAGAGLGLGLLSPSLPKRNGLAQVLQQLQSSLQPLCWKTLFLQLLGVSRR